MKRLFLFLPLLVAACGGAHGANLAAKNATNAASAGHATPVRTLGGISEYVLPNGLKVLLVPDGTQSTVTVNVTYFVGSLHEGYGETGMAHLLEHMTFKGTKDHHNILKLVDERGGRANGSTWNDRTNYFETMPAKGDNLAWALELEADRMQNCPIAAEELATEFSVVRNEFEMGENDPTHILDERMVSTAYLWHNYGKSTIGSRADIEKVPAPALRAFYTKYYQPDNALLVVSGKIDPATTLPEIEKRFGAIPKPTRALTAPYSVEPVQDGERSVTLRRNGDVSVVGATYHTVAGASPDYEAVSAALSILTREPSGRLYKALVPTNLAARVDGTDIAFRDPGVATFLVEVRDPKNVGKVKEVLTQTIEGLGSAKLDAVDLERWRNAELKELDQSFADTERVAIELSEWAALGDWRTLFSHREHVKNVTLADVSRVAKAYFKPSNRTLGEFVPTKEVDRAPFTETPAIAGIVDGVKDTSEMEAGETFDATLDTIQARLVTKHVAGGLDAAFLPKKTRGGRVHLTFQLRYGDATSLAGKREVAGLAAAMLERGTQKHGYQELRDAEDAARSTIRFYSGGPGVLHVSVDSFKKNLPAAIDLVTEMLTTPTFPEKELEALRAEAIAEAEQKLQDPSALANVALLQTLNPWPKGDPRATSTPAERLEAIRKVTAADLRAFHKELVGGGHGQVVGIGDLDIDAVMTKLDAGFGSWTAKKPYARLEQKLFDVPGGAKTVSVKDKEMAQLFFGVAAPIKEDSADYAAWYVLGQILGGDTGSRIWMRVREKEGLSYGAGAHTYGGVFEEVGGLTGYAIVAPQNADKALASLDDEVARAAAGTVTPEELARAKALYAKQFDNTLSHDDELAALLAKGLYTGRTLAWQKDLLARIAAVTAADVERVAKKYLVPGKVVRVKAGSF